MPPLPRLYVFTVSHFCEKARWACDRKGLRYQLVTLLPGAHLLMLRRWSRESHVPLLLHGHDVIQDSSAIIDYLDASYAERPLTPRDAAAAAEAREWETLLDRELGETSRRLFYYHALQNPRYLAAEYSRGGPRWSPLFFALALPTIARAVAKMYDVTAANAERDLARLEALFARLDRHFSARRYLAGDHFSRADLTFAALAAPLLRPRTPCVAIPEQRLAALVGRTSSTLSRLRHGRACAGALPQRTASSVECELDSPEPRGEPRRQAAPAAV